MPAKYKSPMLARLFCGLLRLKFGQEPLRRIFLLPICGVFQELLELGYGIRAVTLAVVDLGQEQIKRRLIVIYVNLHGLQRTFLCLNGIVQVKVSDRAVVIGVRIAFRFETQGQVRRVQHLFPFPDPGRNLRRAKIRRQVCRIDCCRMRTGIASLLRFMLLFKNHP